jgi:insulysin
MIQKKILLLIVSLLFIISCQQSGTQKQVVIQEVGADAYPSIFLDVNNTKRDQERKLKKILLPNQLEVLLISDETAQQSSAAMDVSAGSLVNLDDHLGIAHFLEHMLFMGSKKYPEVDDYSQYLEKYAGYTNAFTSNENTNYHFSVNDEGLECALDRFAQFFIAPLFDPHYIDRERLAVNSEFQKNKKQDVWRESRLTQLFVKKDHPSRRFSTGTVETLKNTNRDVLKAFYEKYYSANLMKLVVKSKMPINKMEEWVRASFASIPNNKLFKPTFESSIYDFSKGSPYVYVKPITEKQILKLIFEVPSLYLFLKTKPQYILASILGYEGEGSLLSELKKKNLVTGLHTGLGSYSYFGRFQVSFDLTDYGKEHIDEIITHFYSYVNLLKKEGLKQYYFDENKKMGEINYVYRAPRSGATDVELYSDGMNMGVDPLVYDKEMDLFYAYKPREFQSLLDKIIPQNMLTFVIAPDVKTDLKEKYYGIEYRKGYFTPEKMAAWESAEINTAFFYPEKNTFLPSHLNLLKDDSHEEPYKIIDDERGVFWFMQDKKIGLPKAKVSLTILTNKVNASPRAKLVSLFYESALHLSMIEWGYPILEAGLSYSVSRSDRGIVIAVAGYADKIPFVIEEIIKRLTTITISEEEFEAVKRDMDRGLKSWYYNSAANQAGYHLGTLIHKTNIPFYLYPPVSSVSLDDVKKMAVAIYKEIGIEALAYGNLEKTKMSSLVDFLYKTHQAIILPEEERVTNELIRLKPGASYYYLPKTKIDNNCWEMFFLAGQRTAELKAKLYLAFQHLRPDFFTSMRSKKQLGYFVRGGFDFFKKALGFTFIIQSGDYDPIYLRNQAMPWLHENVKKLGELEDDVFSVYKKAITKRLQEELKTINEYFNWLQTGALIEGGDFQYREKIVKALEKTTQADVQAVFKKALDKKTQAVISIYLGADGRKFQKPKQGKVVTDVMAFKKDKDVY